MSKTNGWELVAVPSWDTAEDDGGKDAPVFQLAKELPPDHPQQQQRSNKKRKRNRKHESQQPEQTTKAKGEDARASPAKAEAEAKEEAAQKKREPKRRKTEEKKKQKSGNSNQVAAASPPKRKGPPHQQQQQPKQQKPPTQQQKQQQPQKQQPQSPKQQPKKQTALSKSTPRPGATTAAAGGAPPPMTALQQKLYQKLRGSRFRWLNEQLYSVSGDEAKRLFDENPDYFQEYHSGFSEQVSSWPVNPVDQIIRSLEEEEDEEKGAKGKRQKRKKKQKKLCIADFGCGEAKIGATLGKKHTVYSFDLVAVNEHVIACDIANVPLENESVDVAIFCLSLMGSNFMDFLEEAHRVLKPGGRLKIAEVKSRFGSPARVKQFQQALHSLGFDLLEEDDSNKMFVRMELNKSDRESVKVDFQLNVCRYKKR